MMDSRRTPDAGRQAKNAPLDADAGHRRPTTGDPRGINLITTLFILIAISAIGLLLYRVTTTEQEAGVRQLYSGEALYIAEAGVAWATHNLESCCEWGQVGNGASCGGGNPDCSGLPLTAKPTRCQVQLPNGTAYVSVTREQDGAADADTDVPTNETCKQIQVESVGRRLGSTGRILAERRIRTTVD